MGDTEHYSKEDVRSLEAKFKTFAGTLTPGELAVLRNSVKPELLGEDEVQGYFFNFGGSGPVIHPLGPKQDDPSHGGAEDLPGSDEGGYY